MVLALAIGSSVAIGLVDYIAGITLRRDGRMESAFLYTAIGSVLGSILVAAMLPLAPAVQFIRSDVFWSIGAGLAIGTALPIVMVGMARGPMTVVAPVMGLVTLALPAVVGPFVGDRLSTLELVGLLLAFPACALISMSNTGPADAGAPIAQAVAYGAVAGTLFGLAAVCFGQTSTESGILPGVVGQVTTAVLLIGLMLATGRALRPRREAVGLASASGLLTALAVFLSVLAYQRGPIAVVAAVIGLGPGVAVLLAWLLDKERIRIVQIVGFVLGVIAVILFGMG